MRQNNLSSGKKEGNPRTMVITKARERKCFQREEVTIIIK